MKIQAIMGYIGLIFWCQVFGLNSYKSSLFEWVGLIFFILRFDKFPGGRSGDSFA
jgi:hypothetical protein